jgi:rhodanese-related sulfurtransferase
MMITAEFTSDYFGGFVPLGNLSYARKQFLLDYASLRYVCRGEVLFEPGKLLPKLIFLVTGSVTNETTGATFSSGYSHALQKVFRPGHTLRAADDCCLLEVDPLWLDRVLCWSEVIGYLESDIVLQRHLHEESEWMRTILHSNLFYKVPPLNFEKLYDRLVAVRVSNGEKVITQGDTGDCCYFLKEGTAVVSREREPGGEVLEEVEVGYGRCFGEDALVQQALRNANVTMSSDGVLMRMDKRDFIQLMKEPAVEQVSSGDLEMVLEMGGKTLDVRTSHEFGQGALRGSVNMPLRFLRLMSRELDRDQEYVVYCDTGYRARTAASLLEQQGFRVKALAGGTNKMPDKLRASWLESEG